MSFSASRFARLAGKPYVWMPALFVMFGAVGFFNLGPLVRSPEAAIPYAASTTADERLFVYIGSSTCGPSNDERLPPLVATLRARVEASAVRDGRRFVAVGIAKDVDVRAGLAHLAKFGVFDEVMSGRSWANVGVLKYVFGDQLGPGATPQLVIIDRHLENQGIFVEVTHESVRLRRVGLQEVREWVSMPGDDPLREMSSASR